MLSLAKAIKDGKLTEFIAKEESRGVGPIDRAAFDALLNKTATVQQSEDQTLRSPLPGGSSGKRTRQGNVRRTLR